MKDFEKWFDGLLKVCCIYSPESSKMMTQVLESKKSDLKEEWVMVNNYNNPKQEKLKF